MWDGQDFNTVEDGDEERRDTISVSGCQGLPVAVMVVKGHRDRGQRGGGGGSQPDTFFYLDLCPKQLLHHSYIFGVFSVNN